jgi:hypothetical protein
MVSIPSLWLPILLSAVFVFVASSLIHMVLGYHKNDVRKLPNEEAVSEAFRSLGIAPGDYALPCASSTHDLKDPAFQARLAKGPLVFMTVAPGSSAGMGPSLAMWFVYCVVVGVFAAYIAGCGQALANGGRYNDVGAVFGRARPATGFATDLKALLTRLPLANADDGAISMPDADDPALDAQVRHLRAAGEVVINCLSGAPDPRCDRHLVEVNGQWQVQKLHAKDRAG